MKYLEKVISQKSKEAGMEPYTVTLVGTEVFITPEVHVREEFEIPKIDVSDVPEVFDVPEVYNVPDVLDVSEVYPEMSLRFYFYVMLSI